MKTLLVAALASSFAFGCAASPAEDEDFPDPDAKADGTTHPGGLYRSTTQPEVYRLDGLELRSDGTVYTSEASLVDGGDGNIEEGVSHTFGTYKFTKDSHHNTYIRIYDPEVGYSTRWPYRMTSSGEINFLDRGTVLFSMKREASPSTTFVAHAKDTYATAQQTPLARPLSAGAPEAFVERWYNLEDLSASALKGASYEVDGEQVWTLAWGTGADRHIEVFASDDHLIANAKTVEPLEWAELTP